MKSMSSVALKDNPDIFDGQSTGGDGDTSSIIDQMEPEVRNRFIRLRKGVSTVDAVGAVDPKKTSEYISTQFPKDTMRFMLRYMANTSTSNGKFDEAGFVKAFNIYSEERRADTSFPEGTVALDINQCIILAGSWRTNDKRG